MLLDSLGVPVPVPVSVPVPVPAAYFVRTISQELLKVDTSNLVPISIGVSSCASRGYFVDLTFDLETILRGMLTFLCQKHISSYCWVVYF